MPLLVRDPGAEPGGTAWVLLLRADERDEAARDALEDLLPPVNARSAAVSLAAGSAFPTLTAELCENCPVMKWRAGADGLHVTLNRTALKALTELWETAAEGLGEYALEVLDLTAGPRAPARAYLTLRLREDGP